MKFILTCFFIISIVLTLSVVTMSHNKHKLTEAELQAQITDLNTTNESLIKKLDLLQTEQSLIKQPLDSLLSISQLDLMEDILQYSHLSDKQKQLIVETVFEESAAYNINPIIVYSLIHAESSFRFWIEHPQTTINGQKMRAVGLGGIMWYWWGDMLSEANIASFRSELFDPVTNIKATVFIYNHLLSLPMHKDAKNIHHSAMLRYFGGSYQHYVKAIEAKILYLVRQKLYQ